MLSDLRNFEHYVVVDNYCAWPNLTILKDGSVGALIFNKPSHGGIEGDIELWVSPDGRPPWTQRSVVARHTPDKPRYNLAAGQGQDGVLTALIGGWHISQPHPIRTDNLINPTVFRSADSGHTWEESDTVTRPPGSGNFVAFGNVRVGQDGALYVPAYDCRMSSTERTSRLSSSYVFRSDDNGHHWGDATLIGQDGFTETDILQTAEGHWLATCRTLSDYAHPEDPHGSPWVSLFRGDAKARRWVEVQPLTLPSQHPGNLLHLQDGRILLTCGSRIHGLQGVFVKVSADGGRTWGDHRVLVSALTMGDCGYPSTVQLEDGTLVTAYYANNAPHHRKYHLAIIRWRLE
ncbi:MAG: hypothetical protein CL878_08225 [Dehalococcoidia bacterium]|nr:hypothetical protein [Dehalococcoidia bacterium]